MTSRTATFRQEFGPMLRLAWPMVLANLSWVTMGIVDTMMVGRVSPVAIGAVSLGGVVFFTVATFGYALLLGLDTLVPQAFGAGNLGDCRRSLVNSLYLCLPLGFILMAAVRLTERLLQAAGVNAAVLAQTIPYMRALDWSIPPLLVFAAFGGYLRGMNRVKPAMFAGLSANLLNAGGDWILIFGHGGFPRMGAEGSGWATTLARIYMALVVLLYTLWHERRAALRLDSACPRRGIHGVGGSGFPSLPTPHCPHLHARRSRGPHRSGAAGRRGRLPALRRHPDRGHRGLARRRRHAHAHGLPLPGLLAYRPAARLRPLLQFWNGCPWLVDRPFPGFDPHRPRVALCLDAPRANLPARTLGRNAGVTSKGGIADTLKGACLPLPPAASECFEPDSFNFHGAIPILPFDRMRGTQRKFPLLRLLCSFAANHQIIHKPLSRKVGFCLICR